MALFGYANSKRLNAEEAGVEKKARRKGLGIEPEVDRGSHQRW